MKWALAFALTAATGSVVDAAPPMTQYEWRNVAIGGGGFVPNVVFSAVEKGLAYVRTDVGGAYRWDAARQSWIPLQDSQWQGSYFGVESIAPDPRDPKVVYLAGGMYYRDPAAIMRSADRGQSWQVTPVPFRMGGNEDGRGMGERLAIDPNRPSTLFFGSRHDGLWRSDDRGSHWTKVNAFPWAGLGAPLPRHTHGGVSFVVFDPTSGRLGSGSATIFAGIADPAGHHLIRSRDGGKSWAPVPGEPPSHLLPVKAAIDARGILYVDYCTGIGPNDVADGAVWKLDTRTGKWTDITPVKAADAEGGYMGLTLDPARPGRVAVSTVDRWNHHDTVWLSEDAGAHWTSLRERSSINASSYPYFSFGKPRTDFGHWMSGLAFDPFDSRTLAYTTGGGVLRTEDAGKLQLSWRPWVAGMEETVPLSLASPTNGAHLVSGIGDVHGFVHDRLDAPPARPFSDPNLPNTNNVDFAGLAPNILVRSASPYGRRSEGNSLGWSDDGGRNWHELAAPAVAVDRAPPARIDTSGDAPITVSADGITFVVSGPAMLATADHGRSWWQPQGLPRDARALADKMSPLVWYAVDYRGGGFYVSRDGARTFARMSATGLPASLWDPRVQSRETPPFLLARPEKAGELWFLTGGRFYRSRNFGRSFVPIVSKDPVFRDMFFVIFGLGKAAPGASAPALYAYGVKATFGGLWRSINGGQTWTRINDDQHQWGLRYRVIAGDPRVFGRVYLGTDGRGILYGDPAR